MKHPVSLMLSWGCEEQWQEDVLSKSADLISGSLFSELKAEITLLDYKVWKQL